MPDIHEQYERELRKRLGATSKRIKKTYEKAISEVQITLSTVRYKGIPFAVKDYPALQKKIETVRKQMHASIYATTVNSIKDSWDLSNKKNNVLADKRLVGKRIPKQVRQAVYNPNLRAKDAFVKRQQGGMNLSDRIWKTLDPFKYELEQSIGMGLGEGKPARDIAKNIKQYLNEPDRLFRRVRGEDGKLHLSHAAREYHPGQGVYRSSFKNAMRVARTETNDAYRSSDHERWKNMGFITGIVVKLSNSHPRYDICDNLVGQYPKDFKFRGWHPQCLCYAVPQIMNDEEFEKLEDQILAGEPVGIESKNAVTKVPKGFTDYLRNNKDRIAGWKSQPYWITDNPQYLNAKPPSAMAKISVNKLKRLGFSVSGDDGDLKSVLQGFDIDKFNAQLEKITFSQGITIKSRRINISSNSVSFGYSGDKRFELHRRIWINPSGKKEVDHALFTVADHIQGSGLSKEIFQELYEQYVATGVTKINVHANIDVGGYAWARYGFAANSRSDIVDVIDRAPRKLTRDELADFDDWLADATKANYFPMWELANRSYGKKLLLNSDWHGSVDLDNPIQRKIFEDYLLKRK